MNEFNGLFSLTQVGQALGLEERAVRHLAETQQIETLQFKPRGKRYVPIEEIERLANEGKRVNWDALIE